MNIPCSNCSHNKVCKYIPDMEVLFRGRAIPKPDSPLEVKVSCRELKASSTSNNLRLGC